MSTFRFNVLRIFLAAVLSCVFPAFGGQPQGLLSVADGVASLTGPRWQERLTADTPEKAGWQKGLSLIDADLPLAETGDYLTEPYLAAFEKNGLSRSALFAEGEGRCTVFQNLVEAQRRDDSVSTAFFFGILTASIFSENAAAVDPVICFLRSGGTDSSFEPLAWYFDWDRLAETSEFREIFLRRCGEIDLTETEWVNANAMMVRLFLAQWTERDEVSLADELVQAVLESIGGNDSAREKFYALAAESLARSVSESVKAFQTAEKIAATDERCEWYYLHGLYELEMNCSSRTPKADRFARPFYQEPGTPRSDIRILYDPMARKNAGIFGEFDRAVAVCTASALRGSGKSVSLLDFRDMLEGNFTPRQAGVIIAPARTIRDYAWYRADSLTEALKHYAENGGKILFIGPVPEPLTGAESVLSLNFTPSQIRLDWGYPETSASPLIWDAPQKEKLINALDSLGFNDAYEPGILEPVPEELPDWNGQTGLDFGF